MSKLVMPNSLKKSLPHIALMCYVVVVLFPFVFILFSSFKASNIEIVTRPFSPPSEWHWQNYTTAWSKAKIGTYFWNSLYLATSAAFVGVFFAAATAFALVRMQFNKISKTIYSFILVGMLIPGNVLFIAQYFLIRDLHIMNTHWALFLPYAAGAVPLSILLIAAFMRVIPKELEEAAVVDGLGALGIFLRIVMPLTVPALVTVFILNFIGNWNEFLLAYFFISKDALRTLPTGMVQFRDVYKTDYKMICTGIIYSVTPVLILYIFLQRQIIEGLTAGSVKG